MLGSMHLLRGAAARTASAASLSVARIAGRAASPLGRSLSGWLPADGSQCALRRGAATVPQGSGRAPQADGAKKFYEAPHGLVNEIPADRLRVSVQRVVAAGDRVVPSSPAARAKSVAAAGRLVGWVTANGGHVHPGLRVGPLAGSASGVASAEETLRTAAAAAASTTAIAAEGNSSSVPSPPASSHSPVPSPTTDIDWGLYAGADIEEGDIIISLPTKLCLSPFARPPAAGSSCASASSPVASPAQPPEELRRHAFLQAVAALMVQVPAAQWQVRLGVRLLAERAQGDSFFKPYIDLLPAAFPTHPLFFTPTAVRELQYPAAKAGLTRLATAVHGLANRLGAAMGAAASGAPAAPPLGRAGLVAFNGYQVSAADLSWATCAVTSRSFSAPVPLPGSQDAAAAAPAAGSAGAAGTPQGATAAATAATAAAAAEALSASKCFMPLIDMANTSFLPNARIGFRRSASSSSSSFSTPTPLSPPAAAAASLGTADEYEVVARAVRRIPAGEEITINYFQPRPGSPHANETLAAVAARAGPYSSSSSPSASPSSSPPVNLSGAFAASLLAQAPAEELASLGQCDWPNEEVLINFGYVPTFNPADFIVLDMEQPILEQALDVAAELPSLLGRSPSPTNTASSSSSTGTALPLVPAGDKLLDDQRALLDVLRQSIPPQSCRLTWAGPTPELLALLRIAVAGAHLPKGGDVASASFASTPDDVIDRALDAAASGSNAAPPPLALTADPKLSSPMFDDLLDLATAIAHHPAVTGGVTGTSPGAGTTLPDIVRAWGGTPLSEINEAAAALLLYSLLSLSAAGFPTRVSEDRAFTAQKALLGHGAEYTARRYALSKKLLVSHGLRTLAVVVGADKAKFQLHKRLD